jgi:hypothetical protein
MIETPFGLIIAGGRDFTDYAMMEKAFMKFVGDTDDQSITIISGTAGGADRLGERIAKEYGLPLLQMPANWNKHGKSAGYIRNAEMAVQGTHLLAMWDGQSRGTKHMIETAMKQALTIEVVMYTAPPRKKYSERNIIQPITET